MILVTMFHLMVDLACLGSRGASTGPPKEDNAAYVHEYPPEVLEEPENETVDPGSEVTKPPLLCGFSKLLEI